MSRFQLLLWALLGAQTLVVGAEPLPTVNKVGLEQALPGNGEGISTPALTADEQLGRQLYLEGKLADGKPLVGKRSGNVAVKGHDAACVQCHRRSGLGGVEGNETIPPISGLALFGGGAPVTVQVDKLFNRGAMTQLGTYNQKSFAAAVQHGKHVTGRKLSALMPRYDLSDEQLRAVSAYLRTLSANWSPGVSQKQIHLATVITPGVSPERSKAFVDTLNAMLNQYNVNVATGGKHKVPTIEKRMNSRREWTLDIWELTGPSSTWAAQLDRWQQQNPAFAILSGLAEDEWQPVQDFCDRSKVVCWFPSVDLVPENAEHDGYGLYLTGGVQLEAKVIANQLLSAEKKPKKIVQLLGANPLARGAAATAHQLFAKAGIDVQDVELPQAGGNQAAAALKTLESQDGLLLWLKSDELNGLIADSPAPASPSYLSATLIGEVVPAGLAAWSNSAWLVQRQEMPRMRAANLAPLMIGSSTASCSWSMRKCSLKSILP
jgi:mono/diheme cytochrome c family protein